MIRRIVVLGEGSLVTEDMLPADFVATETARPALAAVPAPAAEERGAAAIEPLWQQEQRIIEAVLAAFEGNISRAAAALEISPSTIYRKRQSWTEAMAREALGPRRRAANGRPAG
jgi:two-component system repressor protein LuxO